MPPSVPLASIRFPEMVKEPLTPIEPPQVLSMVKLVIEKEVSTIEVEYCDSEAVK